MFTTERISKNHRRFRDGLEIENRYKGGGGGAPSTTTTVQKSDPWGGQQPYLTDVFSKAKSESNRPMQFYPYQTVANFSPEQTMAHSLITGRALGGSPVTGSAQDEALKTLSGEYLTPQSNPYLSFYAKEAMEQALPSWDNTAVSAGRYGGGAWALGREKLQSDILSKLYGGAYEGERARQMSALGQAIPLADEDYKDYARLATIGEEKQAMQQALIDEARKRWDFSQMEPWQRLQQYSNLIQGHYGGTTTAQTPYFRPSTSSTLLGTGLVGAGMLSELLK